MPARREDVNHSMKLHLFYGWYIVAASLVLLAFNSSVFVYGFTAFVDPIVATFGWTAAQVSMASSMRGLETGIFNPIWGAIVDRWSPRKLMLIGVIFTGAGLILLSQMTNLAIYFIGFTILGIAYSLVSGVLPNALISRWFRRDIGKANGVFYLGLGAGGVLVPVVSMIVDRISWQTTLLLSGIGFLLVGIPLSFVYRSRPEDYGLVPDGPKKENGNKSRRTTDYNFGTSVKDIFKMRAFWHIGVVTMAQNSILGAITLFAMPYLTNLGVERSVASMVVSLFTFISLFMRVPVGALADIFKKKYMIALTMAFMGIGMAVFWVIDAHSPFWVILLFCIAFGFGISGVMPLRSPILAEYFGTKNFGTVYGLNSIFVTVAGVASAPIAGWVFDTYHSYKPFWLAMIFFSAIAVVTMLMIPPVRAKTPEQAPATPGAGGR